MKNLFLSVTVLVFVFYSCNNKQKKAEELEKQDKINSTIVEVGKAVSEFSYVTLDSDTIHINDLKGKVVFMNFFATWCPICIKELPYIESDIWNKYKDNENFELIVLGREHTADEMIAFKEKTGYHFPIVPDPGRRIYSLFAKKYIPRNIVLNKDGMVIYESTGYNEEEFAKLKELLQNELKK